VTKRKTKSHTFAVDWQLYPGTVIVSTELNDAKLCALLRNRGYKLDRDEVEALSMTYEANGCTIKLKCNLIIIRLVNYPRTSSQIASVAHEAFHAVCMLFRIVGIPLGKDSEEAFAYALAYLTRHILNGLS
jgi:hypothetical protein